MQSDAVYWTNKLNGVSDTYELDNIVSSAKLIKHPYIYHIIGFNYFTRKQREKAKLYLNECVRLCLENYNLIKENLFIDSLGSSLFLLTIINKSSLENNRELWIKYVLTSYYSLTKAISVLPVAFDTYRNRALLFEENSDILTIPLFKYVGMGTLPDTFIFSDYYSALQDAGKVGAMEMVSKNSNEVQDFLNNSDIEIQGRSLNEWNLKEVNEVFKRHHQTFINGLSVDYFAKYHLNKNELIS